MPQHHCLPAWFDKTAPSKVTSIALLLGAMMAPAAQAQEDDLPLFLTVSQTFTRDSNLFRDDANKQSDTISSTALRVGVNKAYGRQSYRLDVTASRNSYSEFDQFNYNGLVSSGEFLTDIGSHFRLTASAAASETLPKFEDSEANRTGPNTLRVKRGGLDLRYGLHGRMSLNMGYSQNNQKYRITTSDNRESDTWNAGVRYQPTDLMFYGLNYSQTDTKFVDRVNKEEVQRRNLSLVANWRVTGFSLLSGSLGYTRERYEKDPAADFNGVTGSAAWTFTPAGKVSYRLNWLRDTNNQGGFTAAGGLATVSQQRLTNQFSASASWQATSKISANLQVAHIRYDEERSQESSIPVLNADASQNGRLNSVSLGVDYQPIRSLSVGCDVQQYDRTRSEFSRAYSGRSMSCSVGFTLD